MTRREFEKIVRDTVKLTASQYTGFAKASAPHVDIHFVGTFSVRKDRYNFKFENEKNNKNDKTIMKFDFNVPVIDIGADDVVSKEQLKDFQECVDSAFRYIESVYFAFDMRNKYESMDRDVFDDYWYTLQRCLHFALPCIAHTARLGGSEN